MCHSALTTMTTIESWSRRKFNNPFLKLLNSQILLKLYLQAILSLPQTKRCRKRARQLVNLAKATPQNLLILNLVRNRIKINQKLKFKLLTVTSVTYLIDRYKFMSIEILIIKVTTIESSVFVFFGVQFSYS